MLSSPKMSLGSPKMSLGSPNRLRGSVLGSESRTTMTQTIAASVGQSWFASRTVRRQWKSLSLASSHRRLWTTRDKESACKNFSVKVCTDSTKKAKDGCTPASISKLAIAKEQAWWRKLVNHKESFPSELV